MPESLRSIFHEVVSSWAIVCTKSHDGKMTNECIFTLLEINLGVFEVVLALLFSRHSNTDFCYA